MKHFNLLFLLSGALSASSLYLAAAASLDDAVADKTEASRAAENLEITLNGDTAFKNFTEALLSHSKLLSNIRESEDPANRSTSIDISSIFKDKPEDTSSKEKIKPEFKFFYNDQLNIPEMILEDIHGLLTALSARELFSQTLAAKSLPELLLLFLVADKLQVDLTAISTIADSIVEKTINLSPKESEEWEKKKIPLSNPNLINQLKQAFERKLGFATTKAVLEGHTDKVIDVAFSPNNSKIASGSRDKTIKIWDAATGGVENTLKGHTDWVTSVAFSPDGLRIASGSNDRTVRIWDAVNGKELELFKGPMGAIQEVVFLPDGRILASVSGTKVVSIFDMREVKAHGLKAKPLLLWGLDERATSIAFNSDGTKIAYGSDTLRIWDAKDGEKAAHAPKGDTFINFFDIAFNRDGTKIASGSFNAVSIWDASTRELLHKFDGNESQVMGVAFSPDGGTILSGSVDPENNKGIVSIKNVETGDLLQTLNLDTAGPVLCITFSPDGKYIAAGSDDKSVRLWSTAAGLVDKIVVTVPPLPTKSDAAAGAGSGAAAAVED
jgi:WD40 repeat protein